MTAAIKKVLDSVKGGKYDPVYFLQGEEGYFIDRIADHIEANAIPESEKGFNQVVVYGKDVTMATILTHARRFPMMAEKQVVMVKEAQDIQDLNKDSGAKLLLDYLTNPVPSTILVFCHKHKHLDKRKELGKTIDKLATTILSKKVYENQLPGFVEEYAREKKVKIESGAITILCEYVGNDLSRLTNEFDKLVVSLKEGEGITADRVMSQVGISKEHNIFELQRAIISKDHLKATRIVNYFERNTKRNPVIPAVAYLYSFFSKLLIASQAQVKSDKALASTLRINPYVARDYSVALHSFPTIKIAESIHHLKEADLKLKGVDAGSATEGQVLRELIYRLMN